MELNRSKTRPEKEIEREKEREKVNGLEKDAEQFECIGSIKNTKQNGGSVILACYRHAMLRRSV